MSERRDGEQMASRAYLSADEILQMEDREIRAVQIKQWQNKWVTLRALDGNTAIEFQEMVSDPVKRRAAWIDIVALSAVRNIGTEEAPSWVPLFTKEQAELLRTKSAAAMISLQKHISEINGFNEQAVEEAGKD